MTQIVEYQGVRHEFPDDFTDDEISQALAQPQAGNQGGPPQALQSTKQVPGSLQVPEKKDIGRLEAAGLGVQDAAMFGAADEAAGWAKEHPLLTSALAGIPIVGTFAQQAQDLARTYGGKGGVRVRLSEAQKERPISFLGGQVAGAGLYGGPTAGAFKGAALGLGKRVALGALLGGATGGAYGYASGENPEQRADMAKEGAGWGAAFGGGLPLLAKAAEPITAPIGKFVRGRWSALIGENAPKPAGLSAGAGSGDELAELPTGQLPLRDKGREQAIAQLAKIADRRGMTENDIDAKLDAAIADPRGRVAAELFGEQGTTRLKRLAEMPGKTADPLAEALRERFREQTPRLMKALDNAAGPQEARQALAQTAAEFEAASKDLYKPVLAQDIDPHAFNSAAGVLTRFDDKILTRAQAAMDSIAQAEGRLPATMTPAEKLHYFKLGLDDAISGMMRDPDSGMTGNTLRANMQLKHDYLKAVDAAVPGYAKARNVWGGIKEAEDAVEAGQNLFKGSPDDAIEFAKDLPESQMPFFTAGAKTAIRQKIESGDKSLSFGARNVADQFLSSNQGKRLQAALGKNAPLFIKSLQSEDAAYRSARSMMPGAGSQTFRLFQDLADEGVPITKHAMTKQAARVASRLIVDPVREHARNIEGAALSTPIDPGSKRYSLEEVTRLRRLLKESLDERRGRTRSAIIGGVEGGIGGTDQQQ